MRTYEIVKKKNQYHKKNWGEKIKATMVNFTNLLPGISDRDNSIKRKAQKTMKLGA
jgi:hypothetical protein